MKRRVKAPKPKNPVERMIQSKQKLINRLHEDIAYERRAMTERVKAIQSRIRLAQAILRALQKGELKP